MVLLRVMRLLWYVSLAAFMGANLTVYGNIGDYVTLPTGPLDKQTFYFVILMFFILLNGAFIALGNIIPRLPRQLLTFPQKDRWLADAYTRKEFFHTAKGWIKGVATIVNWLVIFSLGLLFESHGNGFGVDFTWGIGLCLLLGLGWGAAYFYIFNRSPQAYQA